MHKEKISGRESYSPAAAAIDTLTRSSPPVNNFRISYKAREWGFRLRAAAGLFGGALPCALGLIRGEADQRTDLSLVLRLLPGTIVPKCVKALVAKVFIDFVSFC